MQVAATVPHNSRKCCKVCQNLTQMYLPIYLVRLDE
ncbi:DUF6888 family protein [Nostoc sp.]